MFVDGIIGELIRVAFLVVGIYLITGILGLIRILHNGSLPMIVARGEHGMPSEAIYKGISPLDRFLASYTIPVAMLVFALLVCIFLFEMLLQAVWRWASKISPGQVSVLG